jgi:hypothetical protein
MQSIDYNHFKTAIDLDLTTQKISGKILLDRFCVIDEESRRSPAYIDPNFYDKDSIVTPIGDITNGS